jgi:sirohydrochlorin ferrochelatase
MTKKAILVVSHGSRSAEAIAEFDSVVELVRSRAHDYLVKGAHMVISEPDIPTAVAELATFEIRDIVVVPYFLFKGNHTKIDIPEILNSIKLNFPEIDIKLANPIGVEVLMADILVKRALEVNG